ncbi:hypothetical protein [Yinghuangia sp. YIM S10712]|uniref:hypothetical protein n=1 Tax=Yinghuangia sp. YIM S10712 TaxID=3436930 RepID=UPI003F52EBF5
MCDKELTDPKLPKKEIIVEVHEGAGATHVELNDHDRVSFKLVPHEAHTGAAAGAGGQTDRGGYDDGAMPVEDNMSISLSTVDIEMDNQSFGMITACTGCASNIGGPSC